MEESSSKSVLSGYAYYLADQNLLEKEVALSALQQAGASGDSYIDYLVKQKLVDEYKVAKATSDYFGLPLCDITAINDDLIPHEYLNIQLVKKRLAFPLFKKSGLLYMAVTDPTIQGLYEIRFLTGLDTRLFIAEASKLEQVVDEILNSMILTELSESADEGLNDIEVNAYKDETIDLGAYDVESAPIVNYVNRVLVDGIEKKASDIHFEHYENTYRIRFRQHGVLYPITSPPLKLANYILARIKIMAELDITEHRLPQDGRFKLILSKKRAVDFRVSVCPTLFGEKIVLRILDAASAAAGIEKLGMTTIQTENFLKSLERSQGMILVTGPTGSGKTVTLYSALNHLNTEDVNISTVEDPVEIPVPGINQVHVNLKTGMTFSTALRSFLRQDPDVIMVGEIRDLETAEIAVKASQTGHLVLSTLHTNSAPETVTRLINMGVEPFNLASSLAIVIAQRLVRVLCSICKQPEVLPEAALVEEGFSKEEASSLEIFKAVGCEHCTHGYTGRVGIFEVMPVTPDMSQLIMAGGNALQVVDLAKKEGVSTLRESGLQKVREGVTSLSELNRVFK
ncbi:MAG TPA: type IV-A pilus assembly ATPase PilB [Gammaproteobacteria bacterium]|jgi:type IV pilus assembly protein PilB|nr:type IV-A pilus assembly ATPase PilB [Gammaproteobacteria bacterium]